MAMVHHLPSPRTECSKTNITWFWLACCQAWELHIHISVYIRIYIYIYICAATFESGEDVEMLDEAGRAGSWRRRYQKADNKPQDDVHLASGCVLNRLISSAELVIKSRSKSASNWNLKGRMIIYSGY